MSTVFTPFPSGRGQGRSRCTSLTDLNTMHKEKHMQKLHTFLGSMVVGGLLLTPLHLPAATDDATSVIVDIQKT